MGIGQNRRDRDSKRVQRRAGQGQNLEIADQSATVALASLATETTEPPTLVFTLQTDDREKHDLWQTERLGRETLRERPSTPDVKVSTESTPLAKLRFAHAI
jgi:hypothetical protein